MTYDTESAGRTRLTAGLDPAELDPIDRILLGACAAIWLIALGAGVAATVALVNLGRGHTDPGGDSGTPWVLYVIIAVSALVIAGAVPLLLRARREASAEAPPAAPDADPPASSRPAAPARGTEAPTEKLQSLGAAATTDYAAPRMQRTSTPTPLEAAVEQVWLRYALVMACAIGVAMVTIGVGTYLMAVDSNVAAWVFYVLAGLVTAAMPVAPWYFLRELHTITEAS
ncbi:DUF2561 family protein [Mycolicibacterium holsaticum]|jgi:hypothetical protein|uniref:DUF2561 domain-containing protein n=1 Tax=Mycolicibacterium holsaticum TaxID=152142 RepID=A0A1E3RW59_9MYCO|nr:DUF2561 family protein [Mycolicibacterium holsaticum]ODQ94084.1 hypothetical protein BHQ17_10635 [Mycolicibacterium holsaticum]